jgi:hypothetical protein
MKAKFAYCSAAALLAGGLLAASALAQETATTPKLAAGHYLFDAYETGIMSANCPFQAGNRYTFNFVYSTSKNSTMRLTATDSSGSEVVVVSVPKKPSTGPWSVTYTASVYGQNGVLNGTWTGTFTATGVPADTESIAISLQLTNWPNSVDNTKCAPTFNASGAMTGTGS